MTKLPAILARLDDGLDASLDRLSAWLEIPSIGTDPAYNAQTRAAAEWLRADLEGLGFKAELRETGGHPVVLAHRPKLGAPHALFYGHYDVQPVDPVSLWDTDPFKPVVRDKPVPGLITAGTLESIRVADLSKHDYTLEPNQHFTPDGKWLVYRANVEGRPAIYAVELPQAR